MKFFWKIFFAFTAIITMVFSVFGIWLISQTFRNSLNKEIEEGNRENRMFQFAFEVNMNSISENYRTEKIVRALTESVVNNLDKNEYSYKLYRDGRYLVYENQELRLENGLIEKLTDADCVYQVTRRNQLWWWGAGSAGQLVKTDSCVTREDGTFDVEIPLEASLSGKDEADMSDFMRIAYLPHQTQR